MPCVLTYDGNSQFFHDVSNLNSLLSLRDQAALIPPLAVRAIVHLSLIALQIVLCQARLLVIQNAEIANKIWSAEMRRDNLLR